MGAVEPGSPGSGGGARVTRWLYSRKNITGVLLAVVAVPALVLTGVAAPVVGLAALPLLYAAGALLGPSDARDADRLDKAVAAASDDDLDAGLDAIAGSVHGRVADAVDQRVAAISETIRALAPRVEPTERRILVRTVADYLPVTLRPYLEMPRRFADRVTIGGQTAEQVVCAQLDIIAGQLEEIELAVVRQDLKAIAANGEFLADRFGTSRLSLDPAT